MTDRTAETGTEQFVQPETVDPSRKLVDLLDAKLVELMVDWAGKVWVNVDGKCLLRIGHGATVTFEGPDGGPKTVYSESYTGTL